MDDETSNDTEAVEYIDIQSDDGEGDPRPIMLLLKRLINHKQNTIMTNAQIIDILQKELNIDINSMHELEVDIYIKIIKKFLKDWPQWEDLEHISTKLHKVNDYDAVAKVLNKKYKNLKEYLGVMLDAAKPLARSAVAKVDIASTSTNEEPVENIESDVVMEIQCTREQLTHLFFRRPRLDLNTTVFNMSKIEPSRISLKELPFEAILNCWAMKININLPYFTYTRELVYEFKHVLVNKARQEKTSQDINLKTGLQVKQSKKSKAEDKEYLCRIFKDIIKRIKTASYNHLESMFEILKRDLEMFPKDIKVPSKYRRYANNYKYVRYLYAENDDNKDSRYDLQLEETLSPMYVYSIGKVIHQNYHSSKALLPLEEWIQIECVMCKFKFSVSEDLRESIQQHFNDLHQSEPDWQCTHCKKMFGLDYLTNSSWMHEC